MKPATKTNLELVPLFNNTNEITHIWYADKPLLLGGIPTKIPVEELNQKIGNGFKFSENVHVKQNFKINAANLHNKNYMKDELLKIIQNPFNDKLVLCYMNEKVGYGIFAREKIQVGEIVAIYSGEVKIKGGSSDYGMNVDPESNYYIDATTCGGLARFFQHLPLNIDKNFKQLMSIFKQNEALLERYLKLVMAGDNLTREQKEQGIRLMKKDILVNNGNDVFIRFLRHEKNEWELKNLQLKDVTLTKDNIASENLVTEFSTIDNKPVAYLWAGRTIEPGEQLGFDYGLSYWRQKAQMPLLFDNKGSVIPYEKYEYTNLPFKIDAEKYNNLIESNSTKDVNNVEGELQKNTFSFFKGPSHAQWKSYPSERLIGKYIGHQVRFFTMATNENEQAKLFTEQLQKMGFSAELKQAKDKPSIIVDLTTSTLSYK